MRRFGRLQRRIGGIEKWRAVALISVLVGAGTGCSLDSLFNNDQVPPDLTDPAITETYDGALQVYRGVIVLFQSGFGGGGAAVAATGVLSDELRATYYNGGINPNGLPTPQIDSRNLPEGDDLDWGSYAQLQQIRGQANQAIGLLTAYAANERALAGHAYALEGYAEILLAELYCSGIPLSTLDYGGDFTYRPGSTTAEVFRHALTLFEAASTLGSDSARFESLAAIGQGRALLALGDYAAAAAAVVSVPDDYRYLVSYTNIVQETPGVQPQNFFNAGNSTDKDWAYSIANFEGDNGLDYRTSGDPRSMVAQQTPNGADKLGSIYWPAKYVTSGMMDGTHSLILASGVEARLIEAEAALQAGNTGAWLAKLNALRTDGTFAIDTQVVAIDNTVDPPDTTFTYDTLWHAGSGGVAKLVPLEDPDAPTAAGPTVARVNLLFRERALWLFLTGHRQGDLRRLIRQYGRLQEDVYPSGPYPGATAGQQYGRDVALPIPSKESLANPYFHGCLSREA